MALLKKGSLTDDLDIVSEFRPISMTATLGKIFLSIISDRLQTFFVKNNYIQRKFQKGFLSLASLAAWSTRSRSSRHCEKRKASSAR